MRALCNCIRLMKLVDCSGGRDFAEKARQLRPRQERSDEEARRSPAGKRRPQRKSMVRIKQRLQQ